MGNFCQTYHLLNCKQVVILDGYPIRMLKPKLTHELSGNGRRLMFSRAWVSTPSTEYWMDFFTFICSKILFN